MTWVRRQQPQLRHACSTPRGEGTPGDLWRCDRCEKLWQRYEGSAEAIWPDLEYWKPATLNQRIRYWGQGHRPDVGGYQPTDDLAEPPPDYELPPPVADPPPMGHKAPPDLSWIRTETISGSGKRSGSHPLDPPRQTGTDWLYTEREDGKTR